MPSKIRRGFHRKPPKKEEGAKIIIVCEGSKTETNYFNAIRKDLRLPTDQVAVYHPNGTNPRLIVDFARQKRQEQIDEDRWEKTKDSVWAVYDGVEHFRHNPADWHEALDLAQARKINLAITNPSFEFYYLLHFQDQTAFLERDAARKMLKDCWLTDYDKGKTYYPDPLKKKTWEAVERARQLAKYARENDLKLLDYLCAEGVAELVVLLRGLVPPSMN